MKHIKNRRLFENDIAGDPVGSTDLARQNLRIPDTVALNLNDVNFTKKRSKKKKSKRYIK